jgi:hypothetical protein
MKNKTPFKLELQINGLNLKAQVTNISKTEQLFLEDQKSQISFLQLYDQHGKEVEFKDLRQQMDVKWLLPRDEYKKIKPGETLKFREVEIRDRLDSSYHLNWFPFEANLSPGSYTGALEWASKETKWEEFDTQNETQRIGGRMKGVWKGKVKSNKAELILV